MKQACLDSARRAVSAASLAAAAVALGGCDGVQSALAPASDEAQALADLFWIMLAGAAVLWVLMIGLAVYAGVVRPKEHERWTAEYLIIGGGVILPVVVLAGLLSYSLPLLPGARAEMAQMRIDVVGEQWWWRVSYHRADGSEVASANEIRLPVGVATEFRLSSPDVIHSFWIPPLGGKLDMIPGRVNRLILKQNRTGTFRGVCAEYCGTSHALMAFPTVVMEPEAFEAWLDNATAPAAAPASPELEDGLRAFLGSGCGACHAIRGTEANGRVGPDLTHVGARLTLGAATLDNKRDTMRRWIAHPEAFKPGVQMPAYEMLPDEDLAAIALYLSQLK